MRVRPSFSTKPMATAAPPRSIASFLSVTTRRMTMPKRTLDQEKTLQAMREGYKLLYRAGFLGGAWLVGEDLSCVPIRPTTFNGLVIRGLIVIKGKSDLCVDAIVFEYVLAQ